LASPFLVSRFHDFFDGGLDSNPERCASKEGALPAKPAIPLSFFLIYLIGIVQPFEMRFETGLFDP
jgi:hypothetical protein